MQYILLIGLGYILSVTQMLYIQYSKINVDNATEFTLEAIDYNDTTQCTAEKPCIVTVNN